MQLTRKEMLKLSLLGSAALFLPVERTARTQLAMSNRLPESRLPKPFTVPFVRPPVARPVARTATTDYYRLTMKNSPIDVLPGFPKTEVWGYEGVTPGPTIHVRRGRKVVVRFANHIRNSRHKWTSVHLHGNASLPQYDGYASDVTKPGEYKDYRYPNFQDARTLWYHDHGVHHTAQNAYMGCAAFYITHDENELSLPIPHGRYDVPLVLRDALFTTDGALIFDEGETGNFYGDVILANGRPWPVMRVERRKYRFRILNAGVSRSYRLALSTGDPFTVIGTDGGLMPAPQQTRDFRLGMAERYEVVIDFARYKVGEKIILQNLGLENNQDFPSTNQVMRFDVVSEATDKRNNSVPDRLNPNMHTMGLKESDAKRTRRLVFKREGGHWTINGKTWADVVNSGFKQNLANPALGDVEIWELVNNSGGWFHPIHIHLIDFKILDRNGRPPFPYEKGPKDVVYVGEDETVRVITKFGPHRGRYMFHCHNLIHEDHDMMHQFEVGTGGADPIKADPARPVSQAGPLVPRRPRRRPRRRI